MHRGIFHRVTTPINHWTGATTHDCESLKHASTCTYTGVLNCSIFHTQWRPRLYSLSRGTAVTIYHRTVHASCNLCTRLSLSASLFSTMLPATSQNVCCGNLQNNCRHLGRTFRFNLLWRVFSKYCGNLVSLVDIFIIIIVMPLLLHIAQSFCLQQMIN